MGGSKSSSSSKPKDMTPDAFKNLQGPFADVLNNMITQYIPQGTDKIMQGYQGPTTSPVTQGEQNILNALQTKAVQVPGMAPLGSAPPGTGGAMAGVQGQLGPGQGIPQGTQDMLSSTILSGGSPQAATGFVNGLGIGQPQGSLGDFIGQLSGASQTGAFGGDNPFLQSYIEQAQRPTLQGLEETLSRTLPGRFTQAGHIVQPGGSSAFDRAAAIAARGATQEMGDIATRMSYQALEAARGREAGALEAELGRRGEGDARRDQAIQAQLDRSLQGAQLEGNLNEQQAQTQLTQSQVQGQEVDTLIKNLQAQALPRLIQDMGVERGIEAFNNNVNSLLATLGIASGVTRPVVANESKSSSGSFQLK